MSVRIPASVLDDILGVQLTERGEVAPDALMPIENELEERWKYHVPQPIPPAAAPQAPETVRALKLLDPACGSGHFLVIAFDLLAALYREEARHRGSGPAQRELFGNGGGKATKPSSRPPLRGFEAAKATVLGKLERFLERHSSEEELGIRLGSEQLATGLRFLRVCLLNTSQSRFVLESINPTIHFEVGDVNRLPIFPVESADEIYATLDAAFTEHEAARETSVEFKRPGPSPWTHAQKWAQEAVDRPAGSPLPPYQPTYDPPTTETHIAFVSFAFGIAMGRFGAAGEGILDQAPPTALPAGILYLSAASDKDSLAHPACQPLEAVWAEHGPAIDPRADLRTWLRTKLFDHHRKLHENRPIHFPLSSEKKSFVAWISIHRWTRDTLSTLLADHLLPERRSLEGRLDDLRKARGTADKKQQAAAEKRFGEVDRLHKELCAFVDLVTACAEKGPPHDPAARERRADARYVPDLDDGVMVNSAALWPLLDPQWKDPKKWWRELATPRGRKDYDWSHLAARYFPQRVDAKCKEDPSLAVAHACFWKYHPARAYAWELRLQDEIAPDFRIDEPGAAESRELFLREHAAEARAIEETERKRRDRKARKEGDDEGPQVEMFDADAAGTAEEDD